MSTYVLYVDGQRSTLEAFGRDEALDLAYSLHSGHSWTHVHCYLLDNDPGEVTCGVCQRVFPNVYAAGHCPFEYRHPRYTLEVSRRKLSYYHPCGRWMEGLSRELRDYGETILTYVEDQAQMPPVQWAIEALLRIGTRDASAWPIYGSMPISAWLKKWWQHPDREAGIETIVRVTGSFTNEERAEIFRKVAW